MEILTSIIEAVNTFLGYCKQWGISKIFLGLVALGLIGWVVANQNNIRESIKDLNVPREEQSEIEIQHEIEVIGLRVDVQEKVTEVLHNLIDDTGADRVAVFEMHNGTNNPSGLPYLFASMTYEEVRHSELGKGEDYGELTLTRYAMPIRIYKYGRWEGTIEEFKVVDPKLGIRLEQNGIKYIIIKRLSGLYRDNIIGALVLAYTRHDGPEDVDEAISYALNGVQELAILLDKQITPSKEK